MFNDLSDAELLRQLRFCMKEPNSWQVMIEASGHGDIILWPEEEAVNDLRLMRRKGLAA
jgi:hypothetical protein